MMVRTINNRTKKYLFNILNTYGSTFLKEVTNLTSYVGNYPIGHSILKIGIVDVLYYKALRIDINQLIERPYLFLIIDTFGCYNEQTKSYINSKEGKKRFSLFLHYIRKNKYYISDYWFEHGQHCIVLNISTYDKAHRNFIISRYSQMYNTEELKKVDISKYVYIKGKQYINQQYAVLAKDNESGQIVLKSVIAENYGVTDILPDNPIEYDIPWYIDEEIINSNLLSQNDRESIISIKRGDGN